MEEQEGKEGKEGVATLLSPASDWEGAIKQARRQEHKKREGNLAHSRKSRLDIREKERERERGIAVESDPVEARINEHLDAIKTGLDWTGGERATREADGPLALARVVA